MTLLAAAATGFVPPTWLLIPFAVLLACIAVGPMLFPRAWHAGYPWIAVGLGAISAGYYLLHGHTTPMLHAAEEYISFIALIGSLYVISGGIHIQVKGEATPIANCVFLFVGAFLANIIGTTGASMLLIRPWIRMNRYRVTAFHIVFFIFIVSNVGGCLTPIGDPPLFMGYLKGVPFFWVLTHCWQAWIVAVFGLIAIFYFFDLRNFRRAPKEIREFETAHKSWAFRGLQNVWLIGLVLFAVLRLPLGWREVAMIAAGVGSLLITKREVHEANDFNYEPLKEVAWLFLGIFATMVPALNYLQANPPPLPNDHAYYWATGALSGLLDNAPTYLAFLATAMGQREMALDSVADVSSFALVYPGTLEAISLGAVFFGAMTYVGNGPNFMVKAIAEHAKVATPTFVGYIVRYAVPVLMPFLAVVGILFFSRWRIFG